jgi:uncharacterized paraquat-inducible protein A
LKWALPFHQFTNNKDSELESYNTLLDILSKFCFRQIESFLLVLGRKMIFFIENSIMFDIWAELILIRTIKLKMYRAINVFISFISFFMASHFPFIKTRLLKLPRVNYYQNSFWISNIPKQQKSDKWVTCWKINCKKKKICDCILVFNFRKLQKRGYVFLRVVYQCVSIWPHKTHMYFLNLHSNSVRYNVRVG